MPRPKNYILHDFLDKNDANEVVCNNGKCHLKVLNSHAGNLERHLRSMHPDLYSHYIERKRSKIKPILPLKKKTFSNVLNRTNIELAIVELFTKSGQPLHMADDRAFQILVQPAFDSLGITVSEDNINKRIMDYSQKLKADIINDLKGKLLSLKIDAATRKDLCVLGINVQYIKNGCMQIKTLAVKELKSSHTAEYLKSLISDVLEEYAIDTNAILTITTDNATNIPKAVNGLKNDLQLSLEEDCFEMRNNEEDIDLYCNLIEDQMELITSCFSSNNSITGVRCGAHIIHMCAKDVLENEQIKQKLENCRGVVRILRTSNYLNILKNAGYKNPILDCATRWSSTFYMLVRLLELKDIIDSLSTEICGLHLGSEVWNFVIEFIETFKPIYMATEKLQSGQQQLCFSELHVIVMDITFQVEGLPSGELKTLLVHSLNKQKSKLFDMELFNAAVFLDPRIKICMTSEQIERAKQYINSLYKRLSSLNGTSSETKFTIEENLDGRPSTSTTFSAKSFSEFLQIVDRGALELKNSSSLSHLQADVAIYERQSRLPLESNIIDYWSVQDNVLSVIANIILAIPFTQVSVERLFSALTYILSEPRNRLTLFNEEHILMVKANGVFSYEN